MKYPEINITNPKLLRYFKNGKNYEPLNEMIGDRFGIVRGWGLYFIFRTPFINLNTKEYAVGISVPKNNPDTERIKEEILAIAPHLRLSEGDYGSIRISEHTGNLNGTFTILYYPKDNKWAIQKCVHYDATEEVMSLDDLIELLRTKHYRSNPDSDEEPCPDCEDGVVRCDDGDRYFTEPCFTCYGSGYKRKDEEDD